MWSDWDWTFRPDVLIKNKLFFFGSHERTLRRQNFSRFVTVPTAPQRLGDFSSFGTTIYDPLTGNPNGTERIAFPNNMIPANRHSRVARQIIELVPAPTNSALTSNYFASAPQIFDRETTDVKINWSKSEKFSMFGRYSFLDFSTTSAQTLGPAGGSPIEPAGNPAMLMVESSVLRLPAITCSRRLFYSTPTSASPVRHRICRGLITARTLGWTC